VKQFLGTTKICARCGEEKSVDDFNRRSSSRDGRQSYCKTCGRDCSKTWMGAVRAAHPLPSHRTRRASVTQPAPLEQFAADWCARHPEKK
jgi:RNA polymerase subunit RPABC4/transcription elongation factor Spt4